MKWHLRDALAPLLFHDTDPGVRRGRAERSSSVLVLGTEPSEAVKAKKAAKRSADGQRVMRFADLMDHLGAFTRIIMRVSLRGTHRFTLHAAPTRLQEAAFRLLDLDPTRVQ